MLAALSVSIKASAVTNRPLEGDGFMATNSKPVKGKKAGNVKPLMKRVDLPGVKPLMKI